MCHVAPEATFNAILNAITNYYSSTSDTVKVGVKCVLLVKVKVNVVLYSALS